MLSTLKKMFGASSLVESATSAQSVTVSGGLARDERDGTEARNWDAADTTEENKDQWLRADGRTINEILIDSRLDIIARSILEARRNPTVEGVIKSHACDVVGDEGPGLQMMTDDDAWNREAEAIWNEVAGQIDGSGQLSVGEWLRQDMYQSWVTGDMICQVVDDPQAETVVKTRIHPINPNRLRSPYHGTTIPNLMLGIQRNKLNRPLRYHFVDEVRDEYGYVGWTTTAIPARDILHFFETLEPGQICGYPRLASCLQAVSDLREYDNAVLDAAKVQAMMAVVMSTMNPNVEPEDSPADLRLKRMGIMKAPPGWNLNSLQTSHPNAQNSEFRKERSRDLGRPAGMPLMQIRLDSSGHNYSSARFDAQTYQKANRIIQGSLGRHRVFPVVQLVLIEAMQKGILRPKLFSRSQVKFRWPQPPHVDPVKEAMAERIRMENRTLSPQDACSSYNLDFDKVVKDWALANKILEENGLPPLLGGIPTNLVELAAFLNPEPETENDQSTDETSAA
jgi:lambda family phage portal protein